MGSNFDIVFRFSEVPSCLKSLSLISRFQEPARDRERELLAASRAYESLGSLYGQAALPGNKILIQRKTFCCSEITFIIISERGSTVT